MTAIAAALDTVCVMACVMLCSDAIFVVFIEAALLESAYLLPIGYPCIRMRLLNCYFVFTLYCYIVFHVILSYIYI